ncbi:MAG: DEAD/DEAH box helicase [Puniceicoccaceae bacterium 5H]|nr:MAG: DEAD/DEAH box helicase [Puniceicoccaceae bacterium 5H]
MPAENEAAPLPSRPLLAPVEGSVDPDTLLERFLEYVASKGIELYPAQEEAILEIFDGKNVILKTPTGSGKSLVAAAMHFKAVCQGRRSYYTCPIKALVNEKFLSLCKDFGPENVGMSTGDASVNLGAPIICCTAEILANIALHGGEEARVDDVIMDEFHYYSDRERGVAWQIPLLTLPQSRFLLISATMGDSELFERDLTRLTDVETVPIASTERPVPLEFSFSEEGLEEIIAQLQEDKKLPAYLVHFTQRAATETAQKLLSINFCTPKEKEALSEALAAVRFNSPFGKQIKKFLRSGIGVHHAGMLPKYRILVEKLAQENKLKVICGTDTLGVGVNVPIRTVLFTSLAKFDGSKVRVLPVRDFHQISGRAGRKGFDDEGYVIAQAPEHVIENRKIDKKIAENPKKANKLRKSQPPKGAVGWDENTFRKLIESAPEPLTSSFTVNHGMLLNVLSRPTNGCAAMKRIIADSHETPTAKREHRRRALQLFRSLVERGIIELLPKEERQGSPVRVNMALQDDFSLNQQLSLFLVDTVSRLDRNEPEYPRLVLALVEGVLEDPGIILKAQISKVKDRMVAEMKAEGVPYEERMDRLQDVEHPKPYRDWIYNLFNEFAAQHPWVGEANISPKSIGLEMFDRYMSFTDYIQEYELQRGEGLLLRHLSNLYKTLTQTVPEEHWTDEVEEMILYFEQLVRGIDSSILDEWEHLKDPSYEAPETAPDPLARLRPADITRDRKALERLTRGAIYRLLRPLSTELYQEAAAELAKLAGRPEEDAAPPPPATPDHSVLNDGRGPFEWDWLKLEAAVDPYWDDHASIRLDPAARANANTHFEEDPLEPGLRVEHILVDADEQNDWSLVFHLDLEQSRAAGEPRLQLRSFGPVTA